MGYIHCCSGLRKCKTFRLEPADGYFIVTLNLLEKCPICGHKVVLLARINFKHEYSEVRKTNKEAIRFFEKLATQIVYLVDKEFRANLPNLKHPLNYNDRGVKKKCYSSLSSLSLGLFESLDLPPKPPEKIFSRDTPIGLHLQEHC